MNTDEVLAREASAWQELRSVLAGVPVERRTEEGVVPGWSPQDLVWHCGFWAGYVARELEALAAGTTFEVEVPEDTGPGDDLNERVHAESRTMTWEEAFDRSEQERERARSAFAAAGPPTEQLVADFAGETYDHYDEHRLELAAFLGA
ncbi:MAG TPA: maleylpyruvate isomerase N-terminal domain-containing protein [Actinomycetota bacterium]